MAQKPSKNFLSLLSQTEGQIIKRKDLVELAQEVFSLSKFKADGLVDRSIYLLKKNGILSPEGDHNNRGYIFQQEKLEEIRARFRDAIPCTLTSEKRVLENELHLTEYEIEAPEFKSEVRHSPI